MTPAAEDAGMLPGGLWPVMLTPFRDDGRVDEDALVHLVHFYVEAGASGLFASCLSSEMYHLSEEERLAVVRITLAAADARVPVVATGNLTGTPGHDADFIARLHEAGVAAAVLVTGLLAGSGEDEDVLRRNAEEVMRRTGEVPLGLYECPVPYKRLLSPETLAWLAGSGRFLYHKDTSCDLEAIRRKLDAIRGTPLGLYNANTPTALESLRQGARGLSPISANFYPELFTHLLRAFAADPHAAELASLSALLSVMDNVTHAFYPLSAKLYLRERGLPITPTCRTPVPPMAYEDGAKLAALAQVVEERLRLLVPCPAARG